MWFAEVLDAYRMWAAYYVEAREKRNASIQALQFPFSAGTKENDSDCLPGDGE